MGFTIGRRPWRNRRRGTAFAICQRLHSRFLLLELRHKNANVEAWASANTTVRPARRESGPSSHRFPRTVIALRTFWGGFQTIRVERTYRSHEKTAINTRSTLFPYHGWTG